MQAPLRRPLSSRRWAGETQAAPRAAFAAAKSIAKPRSSRSLRDAGAHALEDGPVTWSRLACCASVCLAFFFSRGRHGFYSPLAISRQRRLGSRRSLEGVLVGDLLDRAASAREGRKHKQRRSSSCMTWTVPGLRNTHVESSEASGVFNIPETLSTATLPRSPGRHMRHPGVDVPGLAGREPQSGVRRGFKEALDTATL